MLVALSLTPFCICFSALPPSLLSLSLTLSLSSQLHLIIDTLGTPSYADTEYIASEKAKAYIRSLPYKKRVNYRALYPNAPELALDLLEKMLTFAPEKRITVEEALAHPYLKLLHDPADEPVAHAPFDSDLENIPLNKEALRALLWEEGQ